MSVDVLLDDGVEPGEAEKGAQEEDKKTKGRQFIPIFWRRNILIVLAALAIGFLIGACVVVFSKTSTYHLRSLDDLDESTIDPDTEQIFSFE